jgi:hypothetical protein
MDAALYRYLGRHAANDATKETCEVMAKMAEGVIFQPTPANGGKTN